MTRTVTFLAVLALVTTGCNQIECGEGTFALGENCVGYDPNDTTAPVTTATPPGGRTRAALPMIIALTSDEPATIYHTTDGSDPDPATGVGETSPAAVVDVTQGMTLKFMAVDRAGNREPVVTTVFDSDTTPPAPVTDMTLIVTGTSAQVTWTNATDADYAGTVLARVRDIIDVAPTPGQMVVPSATLSPSVQAASVGTTASFDDASRPPGPVRYVAWTYDDLGNYSAPVAVRGEIPLGSLAAQLTYTNSTLAIATSPANLDLTGTTAAYAGTTLTITLSVKNNTAKYFQNLKAEVTSTTNATFTNSNGIADTFPFRSLGPNVLAPDATVTRDLVFTVPSGTATINLTFAHHQSLLTTTNRYRFEQGLIDLGSATPVLPALTLRSSGANGSSNRARIRPAVFNGGRYLDIPNTHASIERFDLVTRMGTTIARISGEEKANVQSLLSTGSELLAVIKLTGRRDIGDVEVVRLDEALKVTGRLTLTNSDERGFTRPALSADGSTLAIPLVGGIVLVDTRTMTQIDADPSTAALEPIATQITGRLRSVVFFGGTTGLVAQARNSNQASIIKRTATGYTTTLYVDATLGGKGFGLAHGPDGRIWMAYASGIRAYDPVADMVTAVSYTGQTHGIATIDDKIWILRGDRLNLDQVSNTGTVQRTITLPGTTLTNDGAYGHFVEATR